MKVLLTGANGFVGSHILDILRRNNVPVAALLRASSDRSFLSEHLPTLEIRTGSITDRGSLDGALEGITHVIHCAGATKAVRVSVFYTVNAEGTRNVVEAVNRSSTAKRLIHISSLAAAGPGTRQNPARESNVPCPVSEYGRSKLAGETEVKDKCRKEFVVVRPPGIYGPRDSGFFSLFQAVNRHILPRPGAGQALSLVYVEDLASAAVHCVEHPAAAGQTYFVAADRIVTGREMAQEIARQVGHWTVPLPLPAPAFWPVCLAQQMISRVTGKAHVLSLAKYAELKAAGWVCDPGRIQRDLGFRCQTGLEEGIARTLKWYRDKGWLR